MIGDLIRCAVGVPLLILHEVTGDLVDALLGQAHKPQPWTSEFHGERAR